MKDFIDAMSEVLNSEPVKDNKLGIIILFIICIGITIFCTSLIFNTLFIPIRLKEAGDISSNYQKALADIEALKEENAMLKSDISKYKNMSKMVEAANTGDSEMETDRALNTFLKQKHDL